MKQIKAIIFFSLLIILFLGNSTNIQAKETLEISEKMIDKKAIEQNEETIIHFLNEDHLLEGLIDSSQFFYEIPAQGLKKDNYLSVTVQYSDLLLDGSTVTISIDEQRIKSIDLNPKKNELEIEVPLPKFALTEGFHDVEISFYGHIIEELCVNEDNPANWLTVSSASYIYLSTTDLIDQDKGLTNYPFPYIQNNLDDPIQSVIVIPDDVSLPILTAAFKVATYLNNQAIGDNNIEIVYESDLEKVDSHLIIIGLEEQFSDLVQSLFLKANIKPSEDHLKLSTHYLSYDNLVKQALFITAKDEDTITQKIKLLTEESLIEQLSGNHLDIDKLPKVKEENIKTKQRLKDLEMSHLTLSGIKDMTENIFYYIPPYIDGTEGATLNLKLNVSETLLIDEKRKVEQKESAELLIMINDIPHSIAIQNLEKDLFDGFYYVQVPVHEDAISNAPYLAIQFRGLGLKEREICVPPSDDKWIFIHEDSFIQFNLYDEMKAHNFKSWPAPFISTEDEKTMIVVPDKLNRHLINEMKLLISSLNTQLSFNNVQFLAEHELTNEILQDNNLLFLGLADVLKETDDLLIELDDQAKLDSSSFGFINETAKNIAWIQPSIWNEQKMLAIFSPTDSSKIDNLSIEKILNYLELNKENMSIIVESMDGDIFTDKMLYDDDRPEHKQKSKANMDIDLTLFIAITIIFMIGLIVFIIVYRRSKRSQHKE